jgi:hypothetical protein
MSLDPNEKAMISRMASQIGEIYKQWPELQGTVLNLQVRQAEYERRMIQVEGWKLGKEKEDEERRLRVRSNEQYNPDLTPNGGIRLPLEGWERVQRDFENFKRESDLAKATAKGATDAYSRLRTNTLFLISVTSAVAAAITFLITFFAKH